MSWWNLSAVIITFGFYGEMVSLCRCPFYYHVKFVFLVWLQLPSSSVSYKASIWLLFFPYLMTMKSGWHLLLRVKAAVLLILLCCLRKGICLCLWFNSTCTYWEDVVVGPFFLYMNCTSFCSSWMHLHSPCSLCSWVALVQCTMSGVGS